MVGGVVCWPPCGAVKVGGVHVVVGSVVCQWCRGGAWPQAGALCPRGVDVMLGVGMVLCAGGGWRRDGARHWCHKALWAGSGWYRDDAWCCVPAAGSVKVVLGVGVTSQGIVGWQCVTSTWRAAASALPLGVNVEAAAWQLSMSAATCWFVWLAAVVWVGVVSRRQ
jgi:hypothetical protein